MWKGRYQRAIDALQAKVAVLRAEVAGLSAALDKYLAWERLCPWCHKPLKKEDPTKPVRCECGWEWT